MKASDGVNTWKQIQLITEAQMLFKIPALFAVDVAAPSSEY